MSAATTKRQKPILEQILNDFYRQNITAVKKVRDMVKDACAASTQTGKKGYVQEPRKGSKLGEIRNLLKDDLFNGSNWEFLPIERENIRVNGYVNSVGPPTTWELPDEDYVRVCGEIADSRIQGETNIYENTIVAGSISNYGDACQKNDAIYAGNVQCAEEFMDAKIAEAKSQLGVQNTMKRIGDIRTEINADISTDKSTLAAKKGKIATLNTTIDEIQKIIDDDSKPIKKEGGLRPYKKKTPGGDILPVVLAQLAAIGKPFGFLVRKITGGGKGFFGWLGEHCQNLSAFIRKIATQPAFWVALLFAVINGTLAHRLFNYMFTDTLMVAVFTLLCVSGFSILPFPISKDIMKCGENPNPATKARLAFESVLASLLAIAYPVLTSQHSHIYAESEQVQFVAATAVGLLPTITACIIGFMNYWKLKGDGETPILVTQAEAGASETETQPSATEHTGTESAAENNSNDTYEEIIIDEEGQPS